MDEHTTKPTRASMSPCKVTRSCIFFEGRRYMDPALVDLEGEVVRVRPAPDGSGLDVFSRGGRVAQAHAADELGVDDLDALRRARQQAVAAQRAALAAARLQMPADLPVTYRSAASASDERRPGTR